MEIISIRDLTKNYGNGKGIFNVDITVNQGEVFGFLGPNGAGKTTTIRNLLGFVRPENGSCSIMGMDCFKEASNIQKHLGYLAGEIAYLDDLSGRQLIEFLASMKGMKDKSRIEELMEMFELDPRGKVKKMSKGMKQKIAIISAFMTNPEVIILDEPTSGLDPLMQNRFVDLILEEKRKGRTILMSSHIFEEIERTCDRTAIIREGKIVSIENMESLAKKRSKIYCVTLSNYQQLEQIKKEELEIISINDLQVSIKVKNNLNDFLHKLTKFEIKDMDIKKQTLEEIFMHFYGKDGE